THRPARHHDITSARLARSSSELERQQRAPGDFPNALVTMWAWITVSRADAQRALSGIVAPLVGRDPAELRGRICVGPVGECAELLSRYARAGCQRVHFWPLGDERRQIELIAGEVLRESPAESPAVPGAFRLRTSPAAPVDACCPHHAPPV